MKDEIEKAFQDAIDNGVPHPDGVRYGELKPLFEAGWQACLEHILPDLCAIENASDSHSANDKEFINKQLFELIQRLKE